MNVIQKVTLAAHQNGWSVERWISGDGYTRMAVTRGRRQVQLRLRHYNGRPALLGVSGDLDQTRTSADVLRYLERPEEGRVHRQMHR